jgi:hypothetical protein
MFCMVAQGSGSVKGNGCSKFCGGALDGKRFSFVGTLILAGVMSIRFVEESEQCS